MYFSMAHDIFEKKKFFRCTPKAVGVRFKKNKFSPKIIEIPQNHVLWVLAPAEHKSGIEKLLRRQLKRLYVDIFKFAL